MSTTLESISQRAKLVTLPDIYLRLKSVLDDPDSNLSDVAEAVGNDPAMTIRLLQIVNSAYFGLGTEIDTITRAVSLLGTTEVHDLVLAASVAHSCENMSNEVMDMQRFWRRSIFCAISGRELASLCNITNSERLFVAGLLRDIGHLFIYQVAPQKAQTSAELARTQGIPLYLVERSLLGVDYARVGADLMRQWQLPQSLWEPTECQVDPIKSQRYEMFTSLIHIAAQMTEETDGQEDAEVARAKVAEYAWQVTGLSPEQCAGVSNRAKTQVAAVMRLIFPSLKMNAA